jgi:predicted double-glycine peptidase
MNIKDVLCDHGVHIQELAYSCGPCSILNVLHLKGDFSESESHLVTLCGAVAGVGTSNEALLSACAKAGLEILESKQDASLEDVERRISQGGYVIVNYLDAFSGKGHYSVLTDYDEQAVYILDCSLGLLRLDRAAFLKHWHNSDGSVSRWYLALK